MMSSCTFIEEVIDSSRPRSLLYSNMVENQYSHQCPKTSFLKASDVELREILLESLYSSIKTDMIQAH